MKNLKGYTQFINENNSRTFEVTDIIYDADGGDVSDLPKKLTIVIPDDIDINDEYTVNEYISDEISNITGFCHKGFSTFPELNTF